MSFNHDDWKITMRKKYGPNWRDEMRARASVGGRAKTSKGVGRMSPERRAEISRLGVEARRRNATQDS